MTVFFGWEWWHFCITAVLLFMGCLFTNYVIKKFNEARIEERFARLLQGAAKNQGTQILDTGPGLETSKLIPLSLSGNADKNKKTAGISLVFNKEENIIHENNPNNNKVAQKKPVNPDVKNNTSELQKQGDSLQQLGPTSAKNSLHKNVDTSKTKDPGTIVIKDSKVTIPIAEVPVPIPEKMKSDNLLDPKALEVKVPTTVIYNNVYVKDVIIFGMTGKPEQYRTEVTRTAEETANQETIDTPAKENKLEPSLENNLISKHVLSKDTGTCKSFKSLNKIDILSYNMKKSIHHRTMNNTLHIHKVEPKETVTKNAELNDTSVNESLIICLPANSDESAKTISQISNATTSITNQTGEPTAGDTGQCTGKDLLGSTSTIVCPTLPLSDQEKPGISQKTLFNLTSDISLRISPLEPKGIMSNEVIIGGVINVTHSGESQQQKLETSSNTKETVTNNLNVEQTNTDIDSNSVNKNETKENSSVTIALLNTSNLWALEHLSSEKTKLKNNLKKIIIDNTSCHKKKENNVTKHDTNVALIEHIIYSPQTSEATSDQKTKSSLKGDNLNEDPLTQDIKSHNDSNTTSEPQSSNALQNTEETILSRNCENDQVRNILSQTPT